MVSLPVFVGNHHRRFAHRADREDGGFRRVNNGRKVSDAEHAQIGDGEGAVAVLLRLQAPLLGPRHQILGFGGHIGEALILYILYHRYHKAVVSGHGGTYVDGLVGDDLILFQRHVDSGNFFSALQAAMISKSETAMRTSLFSLSCLRKAVRLVVSTASVK